jgi:hypothetical protein
LTVTALPHEPRIAITKRLDALEGIAKQVEGEAQAQSLAVYSQARALLRDLEDLFAEHLPSRLHLAEPLPRVRQHLGAMAGLEEHELAEGVHSHLEQVLADIRRMRAALPPDR